MSFLALLRPIHSPDSLILGLSFWYQHWVYVLPCLPAPNTVLIIWYWDYNSDINTECMSFPAFLPPKHSLASLIFGLSFWYQPWVYILPCPPALKHSPDHSGPRFGNWQKMNYLRFISNTTNVFFTNQRVTTKNFVQKFPLVSEILIVKD